MKQCHYCCAEATHDSVRYYHVVCDEHHALMMKAAFGDAKAGRTMLADREMKEKFTGLYNEIFSDPR